MRISDWSSDVCSSDLFARTAEHFAQRGGFGFGGATSALAIFVDDRSSRRGTLDGGFDTRSGFTGSFTGFGRRGSVGLAGPGFVGFPRDRSVVWGRKTAA